MGPRKKSTSKKKKASFLPASAPTVAPTAAAAPAAKAKARYSNDYARFDAVESDDSDAERSALAAPESLRRGAATGPACRDSAADVADLERDREIHPERPLPSGAATR